MPDRSDPRTHKCSQGCCGTPVADDLKETNRKGLERQVSDELVVDAVHSALESEDLSGAGALLVSLSYCRNRSDEDVQRHMKLTPGEFEKLRTEALTAIKKHIELSFQRC